MVLAFVYYAMLFTISSPHALKSTNFWAEAEMSLYCQGCKSLLAELEFDRGFIAGLIFGTAAVWLVWLVAVW